MQMDNSVPHVPWSRHLATSSNKKITKNSPENKTDRKNTNYGKRQAAFTNRRNAFSDTNLFNGNKPNFVEKDNSWDSQSDPGSVTSTSFNQVAPRHHISDNIEDDGSNQPENSNKTVPISSPENGGDQQVQLRRKKKLRDSVGTQERDFVVEVPMQEVAEDWGFLASVHCPRYVHHYFDFIYYCCLTPNKWDWDKNDQMSTWHAFSVIKKIIYFYIALMASFNSFHRIKYEVVSFIQDHTINQFVDIGYFLVASVVHWYIIYFFIFRQDAIIKSLETWDHHEKVYGASDQAKNKNKLEWLPIILGTGTITMAVLKTVLYTDINSWSFERLLLEYSEDTSVGFFLWKPDHLFSESFKDEYGTHLNGTTFMMGIFGLTAVFCWNLSVDLSKDLIIWVTFVNKNQMLRFGQIILQSLRQKKATGKNSEACDDKCWQAYREVLDLNSVTNSTYCYIFLVNHLHSFVISSYWLTHLLNKKVNLRVLIFVGYNVGKGIFAYFPARKTAAETDKCRKWIQSLPSQTERFRVDDTPYTRELMLMELEKEPIGLGRGKMHINNEFLTSFITLVISLFCFLLNINPKDEEETFRY